jgi:hypothetical protein
MYLDIKTITQQLGLIEDDKVSAAILRITYKKGDDEEGNVARLRLLPGSPQPSAETIDRVIFLALDLAAAYDYYLIQNCPMTKRVEQLLQSGALRRTGKYLRIAQEIRWIP